MWMQGRSSFPYPTCGRCGVFLEWRICLGCTCLSTVVLHVYTGGPPAVIFSRGGWRILFAVALQAPASHPTELHLNMRHLNITLVLICVS